jgi:hypothetical protein
MRPWLPWRLRYPANPPDIPDPDIAIYDWRPWPGFTIAQVFQKSQRIPASLDDSAAAILNRIKPSVKAFLFHIDATHLDAWPADRTALVGALRQRGIAPLNGRVTDISKRYIQRLCRQLGLPAVDAPSAGDPEELLILKTNANYDGAAERKLGLAPHGAPKNYRVLPRRALDPALWADPWFAIERFISNRQDLIWRVRVLGDSVMLTEAVVPGPIKKLEQATWCRHAFTTLAARSPILDLTRRFVHAFGLDHGALDFAVDDAGVFYLTDVNHTPGLTVLEPDQLAFFRAAAASLLESLDGRSAP